MADHALSSCWDEAWKNEKRVIGNDIPHTVLHFVVRNWNTWMSLLNRLWESVAYTVHVIPSSISPALSFTRTVTHKYNTQPPLSLNKDRIVKLHITDLPPVPTTPSTSLVLAVRPPVHVPLGGH